MSDIVERLRVGICYQQCRVKDTASGCECAEAADRIERLEAEVAEQVQWVKDLADGLMEAEGKIGVKEARIAQLEAALRPLACTCEASASGRVQPQ